MNLNICLVLFLCCSCHVMGQTVIICRDDWDLKEKYMDILEDKANQHNLIIGYYTFKDSLPDGEYVYLSINRKRLSRTKSYSEYIEQRGVYLDSVRHGKFIIYHKDEMARKSDSLIVMSEVNYFKGLLHGHEIHYYNYRPRCEGNYTHGLRDGFFYYYDWETAELSESRLYIKGKLIARSRWNQPTVLQPLE